MIAQSEIKREETEPDQMPSFEMDSEYSQDRVKQEIQIEIPATDSESPADSEPLAKRSRDEFKQTKSKSVKKKQKINELEKQLAAMKEQKEKDNQTIASLKEILEPTERQNIEDTDFEVYLSKAKQLKREADTLNNPIIKSKMYVKSVLYFILHADSTEQRGDLTAAYGIFKDTVSLVEYILNYRPKLSTESDGPFALDSKLTILSYRCQSLLYLKLYKMRKKELKETSQKLKVILKNASDMQSSPALGNSEISIPHTLVRKQFNYSNYLTNCYELWEQAKIYMARRNCCEFFAYLDQNHVRLSLDSSLKDLVKYAQAGLDHLKTVPPNNH